MVNNGQETIVLVIEQRAYINLTFFKQVSGWRVSGFLRHGENFAIASGAVGSGVGDTRWGSHKLGLAEAQTGLGRGVVAMVGSG